MVLRHRRHEVRPLDTDLSPGLVRQRHPHLRRRRLDGVRRLVHDDASGIAHPVKGFGSRSKTRVKPIMMKPGPYVIAVFDTTGTRAISCGALPP